jgi:translation elongation factor EF-G
MTSLRSVSQGRASFSLEFSHFEKKLNGEKQLPTFYVPFCANYIKTY